MSTAEQPYQQIGIQSNSGGDINIEQSQVAIAGGDMHIHMLGSAQERELRHLADRLTAFRLLDSRWIEEMQQSEQNARFYEGFRATWSDLIRGLDANRDQFPELLELATKSNGHRALIAIISEMGSGKTTLLKRLALELYSAGSIILFRKETGSDLSADEIRQFSEELKHENVSPPIYLCIDDAARVTKLSEFINQLADDGIKATILLASRTSEWRDANLALTANLDYDPVEFPLSEHLSIHEIEELSSKLHLYRPRFKPLKFDSSKSILVTMMEATGGRGFHEIIKERISRLRRKSDILLTAYEYACLLGQFGLPMPLSVLEALFPRNDILTDILSHSLFREVIEYTEDNKQITPGHELVAQSVIKQQYGVGSTSYVVLVEMFVRLIKCIPSDLSLLVINLLLGLGHRDRKLVNEVISRSMQSLAELMQKSSADELSGGWAKVYEAAGDYKYAQDCHIKALELEENSRILTRYAWFLRSQTQFIEAKGYLERATVIAPDDAGAHSMFGRLMASMLLYEEAAVEFESALRIRPSYLNVFFPIYLPILIYLARYERAEELCRIYLLMAQQRFTLTEQLMWQIALVWLLLLRNNVSAAESELKVIAASYAHDQLDVAELLSKRFLKKLFLSNKKLPELQALLERYIPKVESNDSVQTNNVADNLPSHIEPLVGVVSDRLSIPLSSELNPVASTGKNPPDKTKVLVSSETIRATLKQLRDSGRPEAIPEYLGAIIQQNVKNVSAYLEYAEYLMMQGKRREAENYLIATVVYRNPIHFTSPLRYACFLAESGRVEEARNYFQHASATPNLSLKQFTKGATDYVSALIASNNLQEAITICEQYAIILPDKQRIDVVDALIGDSRYEDLERFTRAQLATTTGASKREIVAAFAIAVIRQGRYRETLPYHGVILKGTSNPESKQVRAAAEAVIYLVRQHTLSNDTFQFSSFGTQHAPDDPYTLIAQGELLLLTKKFTKANQVMDQLLLSNPHFSLAYALRGQLLSWQGNTSQAYSAFEQAATSQKQDPEALAKYCNFLTEQSRLLLDVDSYEGTILVNLALEQGEAAYQLESTNPYVCNNYTYALRIAKEIEKADTIIQKMLKRCSDDVFTLINAGKIKASLGQPLDAVNYHEVAISVAPPSLQSRAYGALGRLLLSLGDQKGAYRHLQEAIKRSRSGVGAIVDMAEWHAANGRLDLAESLLSQVVTRTPGFFQARLRLAELLVTRGKIDQAISTYAQLTVECWEVGRLLVAIRAGYMTLQLLSSLENDKLQAIAVATVLLAGRAACLDVYTQNTANRILQDAANWLTDHPKTRGLLETQVNDLGALLQPRKKIAETNELLATRTPETLLVQFLRSYLKF